MEGKALRKTELYQQEPDATASIACKGGSEVMGWLEPGLTLEADGHLLSYKVMLNTGEDGK